MARSLRSETSTAYAATIPEAAQLVMQAGAMGQGGEIFILDMGQPVKIGETWEMDGAKTATERANAIWKQVLAEAVPPPLDPAVADRGVRRTLARADP